MLLARSQTSEVHPMLCDTWLAHVTQEIALAKPGSESWGMTLADLPETAQVLQAQRFVIAPDAVRVIAELAERSTVDRVRHASFAPADDVWLEWSDPEHGRRIGLLLVNETPGALAKQGSGMIVLDVVMPSGRKECLGLPVLWNVLGSGPVLTLHQDAEDHLGLLERVWPDVRATLDLTRRSHWLVAALCLICAPHLTTKRDVDLSKLNKARRQKGRAEFLSHREISLTLSPREANSTRAESGSERVGRALHHVRAHYRLLPGGVASVRQHMRGDPSYGVTRQVHTVRK